MIRAIDVILSTFGLMILSPLLLLLFIVGYFDTGVPLLLQTRVGMDRKPITLVKFRSMQINTDHVASHLVDPIKITAWGKFIRHAKLDELLQLWNVLKGEMSLVGPRPCLFNQTELIKERSCRGVFSTRPGITGLAQINGINMATPRLLAKVDACMLRGLCVRKYFFYIFKSIFSASCSGRIRRAQL